MTKQNQVSMVRLGIVMVVVAAVLVGLTYFLTGQTGLLRTQIYTPSSGEVVAETSSGSCGPIRKIAYVELIQVSKTLRTCVDEQRQLCRSGGKSFVAAENVRFGEVYADESQDVYWDYVCY